MRTYKCVDCGKEQQMLIVLANRYGSIRNWENKICDKCYEKRVKELNKTKGAKK